MTIVGIAGGAGSGKSTLSFSLKKKYSDTVEVVQFDDYGFLSAPDTYLGVPHWETPIAYDTALLRSDLDCLLQGKPVERLSWDADTNPSFDPARRVLRIIEPKPVILLEGFLVLCVDQLRELCSYSLFLDLPFELRVARRRMFSSQWFLEHILAPLHNRYVEPTKQYANAVIDVAALSKEEVYQKAQKLLNENGFI